MGFLTLETGNKNVAILTIVVGIAAFLSNTDCAAEGRVKVAVILPETGSYAAIADMMRESVLLADRKLQGRKPRVELVFFDNYANLDSADSITLRIAADRDYVGIIAGFPSKCAYRTLLIAEQYKMPYLIASSSADSLTDRELEYTFRLAPLSTDYNDGLISWAVTNVGQGRFISVIHDGTELSTNAVADLYSDLRKRWQGRVIYTTFSPGESEFDPLIKQQHKLKPDLVWLIGSTNDIARFLIMSRQADWYPRAFVFGSVSLTTDLIISTADGAAEYAYGPALWTTDAPYPGVRDFVKDFTNRTGEKPDYHAAEAFAAIEVLASALAKCDVIDRENLRDKLAITNILSVFGKIKFSSVKGYMHQNRNKSTCVQLLDQSWHSVWPLDVSRSRYVYPPPDWRERNRAKKPTENNSMIYSLFIVFTILLLIMTFIRIKEMKRRIGL